MPNRRDSGLGWGDRDWEDRDVEGQWRAYRRPYSARDRESERAPPRAFGRGPDLPYDEFYGRDYGRGGSPESSRYDAEDFGGGGSPDRDFSRRYRDWRSRWERGWGEDAPEYYGYRRMSGYGVVGVYGAPWRAERAGKNYYGRGPRGYRRSDERIHEEVNDRLAYNPDLDATDIEVQVATGIVTLSGVVEDRGAKRLAEDIVEEVLGVDDVHNELKVRHGLWARITGEHVDEREIKREAQREVGTGTAATARTTSDTTAGRE